MSVINYASSALNYNALCYLTPWKMIISHRKSSLRTIPKRALYKRNKDNTNLEGK
jgi:hypothetical protein